MDHYQQTWTTGISAQGEYMWYSSIVASDVIVMTLLLRGHMTLTNTHISGFREVADTKCGQQVPFWRELCWHPMQHTSDVIDVVRTRDFRKYPYLYF